MLAENDRISIPSAGSPFHLLSINMQPMKRIKIDDEEEKKEAKRNEMGATRRSAFNKSTQYRIVSRV